MWILRKKLVSKFKNHKNPNVQKAFKIAEKIHRNQRRKFSNKNKSGQSIYLIHPLEVANTVSQFTKNQNIIIAAILHDCLEESAEKTKTELKIKETFGPEVSFLVKEVSTSLLPKSKQSKMIISMDDNGLLIKLSDILSNAKLTKKDTLNPEHKHFLNKHLKRIELIENKISKQPERYEKHLKILNQIKKTLKPLLQTKSSHPEKLASTWT